MDELNAQLEKYKRALTDELTEREAQSRPSPSPGRSPSPPVDESRFSPHDIPTLFVPNKVADTTALGAVSTWKREDVATWLRSHLCSYLGDSFKKFAGKQLLRLSEEEFSLLVPSVADKLLLWSDLNFQRKQRESSPISNRPRRTSRSRTRRASVINSPPHTIRPVVGGQRIMTRDETFQERATEYVKSANSFIPFMGRSRADHEKLHRPISGSISARLSYRLDNFFARNRWSKMILLVIITLVMISIGAIMIYVEADAVVDKPAKTFAASAWTSWTFIADPGVHADLLDPGERAVGVLLTIGGMLFFGFLLGLIGEEIGSKMDKLKKGTSNVLENNHVLILGWTGKTIPIIQELVLANESEGGGVVVVLADFDKEEMDNDLQFFDPLGTRIVTRSGNPCETFDLAKCSVSSAKSIVVLSPEVEDADEADVQTVRVCLALSSFNMKGHMVVELMDVDNLDIVKTGLYNSAACFVPVVSHDLIGRVMVQSAKKPGVARLWQTLLSFEGDEFYMKAWPETHGMTFDHVLYSMKNACVVGVLTEMEETNETELLLNPPGNHVIKEGDLILVLAEDDDSYTLGPRVTVDPGPPPPFEDPPKTRDRILFCGWRRDIDDMIQQIDQWSAVGSSLTLMSTVPIEERQRKLLEGGLGPTPNLHIEHVCGNPALRRDLERINLCEYDHIYVLTDETWGRSGMTSDSRSIAVTLLIRDIQEKMDLPLKSCTVISEIKDPRTEALMSRTCASDYVVSNKLISLALCQICESCNLAYVIDALFSENGQEIHIKPGARFFRDGETLSHWELMARCREKKELYLGYKSASDKEFQTNPRNKSEKRLWRQTDSIVVISDD